MIGEVALLRWLLGTPGMVNLLAGLAFLHVNVSRCVPNPTSRSRLQVTIANFANFSTFCIDGK